MRMHHGKTGLLLTVTLCGTLTAGACISLAVCLDQALRRAHLMPDAT